MKIFGAIYILLQLTCVISTNLPIHNQNLQDDNSIGETYIEVERSDVTFRLYTRQNPTTYTQLFTGSLANAKVDPTKPFKFITHGYTDNAGKPWVLAMKDAFLKKGDYNVIGVDWSKPASSLYPITVVYTKDVGKYIGELVVDLMKTLSVPASNFHLIGHSLGAHISGFAGQYVIANATESRVARITGMDPAGPLFFLSTANGRLSTGDADFVDIIHSDGGKLGYFARLGDVDFYPAAGIAPQPGCIITRIDLDWASCSHIRSHMLFTESINSSEFISKECSSYLDYINKRCVDNTVGIMGYNIDLATRGRYYLATNSKPPYARNGELNQI